MAGVVIPEYLELRCDPSGRWEETGEDGQPRVVEGSYDRKLSVAAVLNRYGKEGWQVALGQYPGESGQISFLLVRVTVPNR
jgi:hypothetical protein